jgi:hypothetical protein
MKNEWTMYDEELMRRGGRKSDLDLVCRFPGLIDEHGFWLAAARSAEEELQKLSPLLEPSELPVPQGDRDQHKVILT